MKQYERNLAPKSDNFHNKVQGKLPVLPTVRFHNITIEPLDLIVKVKKARELVQTKGRTNLWISQVGKGARDSKLREELLHRVAEQLKDVATIENVYSADSFISVMTLAPLQNEV